MFHPVADCEHPLLCLPGTGLASQETAISGSLQQNLAGICISVCVWWLIMGWTPGWGSVWMVHPFVSAPNFVSVTPSMGVLFTILRRDDLKYNRKLKLISLDLKFHFPFNLSTPILPLLLEFYLVISRQN